MWLNGLNDNVPGYPKVNCEYVKCPQSYLGPEKISYAKIFAYDYQTHGNFFWNFRTEFEPRWNYQTAVKFEWIPRDWSAGTREALEINRACTFTTPPTSLRPHDNVKGSESTNYEFTIAVLAVVAIIVSLLVRNHRKGFKYESIPSIPPTSKITEAKE